MTGVVLAGGRSRRFGRDKLAEPYRGTSILQWTVSRLAEVCDEVLVVVGPGQRPPLPSDLPIRLARDDVADQGPLAGVAAGLPACRTTLALVAGGDMPELSAVVLGAMLEEMADPGVPAVVLEDGDRFRPLPCALRVVPAVEAAAALLADGERRLRALLETLHAQVLLEPRWRALDPEGRSLFDVDEPADLQG
ncbi:MAG TPA: molybdenum cofactor guanylyltransferase [Actinomycetota bacterium]|nr:molybdenum cofactor guanylyltransferase [Actinomycetota bacterium]